MKIRSLSLLIPVAVLVSQPPVQEVVARVIGTEIFRVEIAVSLENARSLCERIEDVGAGAKGCSSPSVEGFRLQMEVSNLTGAIQRIVFAHLATKLSLRVTDSEIQAEWKKTLLTIDADQVAEEYSALNEALTAVYQKKLTAGEAFDRYIAELMTEERWKIFLRTYTDIPPYREMLGILAEAPMIEINELNSSEKESIRLSLLHGKLRNHIDQDLAETDPKFKKALDLQISSNPQSVPLTAAGKYIDRARERWWAKQYSESNIEVLDPRYEEVGKYFAPKAEKVPAV